jgi:hypothetical protein
MNKLLKGFIIGSYAISLIISGICFAGDQEVTVTGRAPITGSKDQAQKQALKEAFRSAVEKGIGVWIKSETEVKNAMTVKDQILAKAEGYVKDHEILKEGESQGQYFVTIRAKVSVDQIGADFKQLLGRVKMQMDNPSITFVLTTWERRGTSRSTVLTETTTETSRSVSLAKIDENLWKKYPDSNIIDSFQNEFISKGFDLKAADKARKIAITESLAMTSVNPQDRDAVREAAEKDGANYVARGEVMIIDVQVSPSTGKQNVTAQLGVEIIDVGSGDIVASYTTTKTAASDSMQTAKAQAIMSIAALGARTLADQTLRKWQERALSGRFYTIEIRNIKSDRSQKTPLMRTISSLATIKSQTKQEMTLLMDVQYQGSKNDLGQRIIDEIGNKPGFKEDEFDGPGDEGGKIIFKFHK